MPELPEVETTRRGIEPHLTGHVFDKINVHEPRLRWPVPKTLSRHTGKQIHHVSRRGKYILIGTPRNTILIHLGMSGSLRIVTHEEALRKHDHVEFILDNGTRMRYHDPRRFGCILQAAGDPLQHELLVNLGPEPLGNAFNGDHLFTQSRKRKIAVKNFIMNSQVVVGVGNIYASEALFMAGIRPAIAAGRVTAASYDRLAGAIREVLQRSIDQGGTTLRDFVNSAGEPGYFVQQLNVYGRAGEPCRLCKTAIKSQTIGQRSSFYCPVCQKA